MSLALHGLWRFVSEPLFTPPDQNFALRHASVIHAALTPQGNGYRVAFRLFRVTGFQIISADCDRDLLALSGIDDGQTIKFDFGHHAPLTQHGPEEEGLPGGRQPCCPNGRQPGVKGTGSQRQFINSSGPQTFQFQY